MGTFTFAVAVFLCLSLLACTCVGLYQLIALASTER
ncbi:hypothetical protein FNPHOIGM_00010 [Dickeya phage DchS19]|uniref:Uncharacterized protein n=1 Tax=Dickeya phage DchS19 TaxID=2951194 RepID=A0A9E7S4M9_9CAUD|nr:hypothetical protein FNPHOIGM_00010 [Dickeya phage DchS19]